MQTLLVIYFIVLIVGSVLAAGNWADSTDPHKTKRNASILLFMPLWPIMLVIWIFAVGIPSGYVLLRDLIKDATSKEQ
jgi:uncharacterized membrane protein